MTTRDSTEFQKLIKALQYQCSHVMMEMECRSEELYNTSPTSREAADAVFKANKVVDRLYQKTEALDLALDDVLYAINDVLRAEERLQALPPDDEDSSKKGGAK